MNTATTWKICSTSWQATESRLSGLTRVTLNDFELPAQIRRDPAGIGELYIHGGKDRTITLNYKACKALKAYLKVRPKVYSDALFINKFREPLRQRRVQKAVQKCLDEAEIYGASVHALRHAFTTHHVTNKTSLRTVQEALGHEDLTTTSVYVSLAREVMSKELQEHA